MTYSIEPVFIVFPLVCLFLSFFKLRNNIIVFFTVLFSFILLFSFSLNGSDLISYSNVYKMVAFDLPSSLINQEIGYYYLNKVAISLGISYLVFRVILLSSLTVVLFVFLRKTSSNFPLSVFFLSSMFVIYTISTYRQFMVMSFSMWGIYLYFKGKKVLSVCGIAALLLFHRSAVVPLVFVVFDWACCHFSHNSFNLKEKKHWLFLSVAIGVRLIMTIVLKIPVLKSILESIGSSYFVESPSFFSLGFASRCFFLIVLSFLYYRIKKPNNLTTLFYSYYSISILIYICVPIQLLMGRLINNANIVCIILIPNIIHEYSLQVKADNNECSVIGNIRFKLNPILPLLGFVFVALVVLVNQLLHQDGYTPYKNIALTRNLFSVKWKGLDVHFDNVTPAKDNPWNLNVGMASTEEDGSFLFLTPGGKIKIETTGDEKVVFQIRIHPDSAKLSDGMGLYIAIMNDVDIISDYLFKLIPEETLEFVCDKKYFPNFRKILISCNEGEHGNSDSDLLIINRIDND